MTQLSTFRIGGYLFGVDVSLVQEIMRAQAMTPVPLSGPEIAGLINLRGEVLTAIDVRSQLGLPEARADKDQINVVVRVNEEPVSLLVDEIGSVIEVSQITFETTPTTVDPLVRPLILGAYTLPDQLLLLLDARKLLALSESHVTAEKQQYAV